MAEDTGISWCHHTFNVVWGCARISDGCVHCYAEQLAKRLGNNVWGVNAPRRTFGDKYWSDPKRWHRHAAQAGERRRVFCSSMGDVFEVHATTQNELKKLWPLIKQTPNLDWLLLTKRAKRIALSLPDDWSIERYPNVWLGTSVENAKEAWRIDELRKIDAVVRFISFEPALGPLGDIDLTGIQWLICGGESGSGFRAMDPAWAREARDRCTAFGTAFYFKQNSGQKSGMTPSLDGVTYHDFPAPQLTTTIRRHT